MDSSVFVFTKDTNGESYTINFGSSPRAEGNSIRYFKMTFDSAPECILPNYKDAHWKEVGTIIVPEEDTSFHGEAWMRLRFKISPDLIGNAGIKFDVKGAAILFIDGKYFTSCGLISSEPKNEIYYTNGNFPVQLNINDTNVHVLSILYSFKKFNLFNEKYHQHEAGLQVTFIQHRESIRSILDTRHIGTAIYVGLFIFFITLSLVHLLLFAFETERKFNLYHSIFMFSLGLMFLFLNIYMTSEDFLFVNALSYYSGLIMPVFLIALLSVLYSIFKKPMDKFYKYIIILLVICLISKFFSEVIYNIARITMMFSVYFSTLSISIRGVKQNIPGAKIVGLGVIGFTFFILVSIIVVAVLIPTTSGAGSERGPWFALFLALCLVFSVISIPISMSVFLAYDFANTNKILKKQIVRIEELNQESIRVEQEKQAILEGQKEKLEHQVKERTLELSEKNEILFTQNKEILDSIRYAKRIQQALITHESYILKNMLRLKKINKS
jgi:hypothetical protein